MSPDWGVIRDEVGEPDADAVLASYDCDDASALLEGDASDRHRTTGETSDAEASLGRPPDDRSSDRELETALVGAGDAPAGESPGTPTARAQEAHANPDLAGELPEDVFRATGAANSAGEAGDVSTVEAILESDDPDEWTTEDVVLSENFCYGD